MQAQTYEKGTADNNKDAARLVAGLRVDGSDLVLNALERKLLHSHKFISLFCPIEQYDVSTPAFRDPGGVSLDDPAVPGACRQCWRYRGRATAQR
jgi:hypothetical protein